MVYQSSQKKDVDEIALMRFKDRMKNRFRAIVRMVIANLYWMVDDTEPYEGDDVQRRVEQAMRARSKKKQLLSINDKALLNKHAEDRTDQEKRYINRIIGGLKCFKRYPNHVKKKLAAVTYFKYYGPNRVIVRQNQEAHALYFIVTGEVIVSQLIYDELLKKHVNIDVFVMRPGDMFGEVSLLHNIPRTATCTTSGHCEFLALMKQDFKNVLQASLQKQWDKVKLAMESFSYFDRFDAVARREGCIVAKMKSYEPNDTILGDGVEVPNFVYFVLSGRCQMIESLNIETIVTKPGKKRYILHDTNDSNNETEQNLGEKYFHYLFTEPNQKLSAPGEQQTQQTQLETDSNTQSKAKGEKQLCSEEKLNSSKSDQNIQELVMEKESAEEQELRPSQMGSLKLLTSESKSKVFVINPVTSDIKSQYTDNTSKETHSKSLIGSVRSTSKVVMPAAEETEVLPRDIPPTDSKILSTQQLPPYDTYFMQVCVLDPGSTFHLGENMRDRRIIAETRVDCMLLPKMWLLQRNTANIWSRILHFLERKIPNKRQLFKEFVKERRWQEYRNQIVADIMTRARSVNYTTVHDVPYSIRINEALDL